MMRIALIADGSSDRMLVAPIRWLLNDIGGQEKSLIDFIDLRSERTPPRTLAERVQIVLRQPSYDFLLVHRDAEGEGSERRRQEIRDARSQAIERMSEAEREHGSAMPAVPVVPVRMSEAWLLFDEDAIRRAARNPRSTVDLNLPSIARLEAIPDPKQVLHEALIVASGVTGRRLAKFRPAVRVHDIQNWVVDWSPLNELSAFQSLRNDLRSIAMPHDQQT